MSALGRGLAAGAVGTTALNAVTYLDMAWRGRPASSTPERSVDSLLAALDVDLPGDKGERANRRSGLGALSGIASGLSVGVLAEIARAKGFRLPGLLGGAAVGGLAMAATNVPMALSGISDPRTWTADDWAADVVPHLAYGIAAHATLDALAPADEPPRRRASFGLVTRSLLLGAAAGSRSSLGMAAPTLTDRSLDRPGAFHKLLTLSALGTELRLDKSPEAPSRLDAEKGLVPRFLTAAYGATALARRDGARPVVPVLAASAGAAAGAWGGFAWREAASTKMSGLQAALVEDGVALGLAALATLPSSRGRGSRQRPTRGKPVRFAGLRTS